MVMNRAPLLFPPAVLQSGAQREGLNSLFKRLCGFNYLSVNAVLGQLVMPITGGDGRRLTRMGYPGELINRGMEPSSRIISAIARLTACPMNLEALTFGELAGIPGSSAIGMAMYRKWCPRCFEDDLATEAGAYERLIWSLSSVETCHTHECLLVNKCRHCGKGPFRMLLGRDLPGFCPACQAWLGDESVDRVSRQDPNGRFLIWVASSYATLLNDSLDDLPDVRESFSRILYALLDHRFEGVQVHLANALQRNRSVINTWLHKRASPSWMVLMELSYMFQLPVEEILRGNIDCVEFSSEQVPPPTTLVRLSNPRKKPKKRDPDELSRFLLRVENGELPGVTTMREVAVRLGLDPRELSRLLPVESARLSQILKGRRQAAGQLKRQEYRASLQRHVPMVVRRLLDDGITVHRRSVDQALAKSGIKSRRSEARYVKELVSEAMSFFDSLEASS